MGDGNIISSLFDCPSSSIDFSLGFIRLTTTWDLFEIQTSQANCPDEKLICPIFCSECSFSYLLRSKTVNKKDGATTSNNHARPSSLSKHTSAQSIPVSHVRRWAQSGRFYHSHPKLTFRAAHKLDCFFHAMHNNDIGNISEFVQKCHKTSQIATYQKEVEIKIIGLISLLYWSLQLFEGVLGWFEAFGAKN